MGLKGYALFFDIAQLRQRKDLEPAAVGQNRAGKAGKAANTAHLAHQLIPGTQMQMIGIAKLNLTADVH